MKEYTAMYYRGNNLIILEAVTDVAETVCCKKQCSLLRHVLAHYEYVIGLQVVESTLK